MERLRGEENKRDLYYSKFEANLDDLDEYETNMKFLGSQKMKISRKMKNVKCCIKLFYI